MSDAIQNNIAIGQENHFAAIQELRNWNQNPKIRKITTLLLLLI
jgi:hypothetical protein